MNQSVQIFIYQLINENPDMSRFSISLCEKKNSDVSGFLFINWIFKIWTCPDFISGRVQIWNFWWKILNLDLSEFQFRTRPDFFFQLKIWNLDLSRYQFWTSDSHVKSYYCLKTFICETNIYLEFRKTLQTM